MSPEQVIFGVDQAGCSACVARLSGELEAVATIEAVEIDADEDVATFTIRPTRDVSTQDVERVLAEASRGSGHEYRLRPGSWRSGTEDGSRLDT